MTDLKGTNLTFSFQNSQNDPNAPYVDTGAAATLVLNGLNAGVVVTEANNAIQESGQPISLVIKGPGQFVFQGADAFDVELIDYH